MVWTLWNNLLASAATVVDIRVASSIIHRIATNSSYLYTRTIKTLSHFSDNRNGKVRFYWGHMGSINSLAFLAARAILPGTRQAVRHRNARCQICDTLTFVTCDTLTSACIIFRIGVTIDQPIQSQDWVWMYSASREENTGQAFIHGDYTKIVTRSALRLRRQQPQRACLGAK